MDLKGFIGGCIGGGAGVFVGHPLDTIKVRLQAQHGSGSMLMYKGMFDCFVKIFKQEGLNGLFKGVTSPVVGVAGQNMLLFGFQRNTMNYFGHDLYGEFYAGCASGGLLSFVSTTIELSKIQMQMQNIGVKVSSSEKRFGPVNVLVHLFKTEGLRGPLRGFWVTLLRDCPGYGVYFLSYAYICELLTKKDQSRHSLGMSRLLLAGGLCGIISWVACYPIDIIKTRVQTNGFHPHGSYKNYLHCLRECYSEGGLKVFTRGLGSTVIRAFPVNATTLCMCSMIERFLHRTDYFS